MRVSVIWEKYATSGRSQNEAYRCIPGATGRIESWTWRGKLTWAPVFREVRSAERGSSHVIKVGDFRGRANGCEVVSQREVVSGIQVGDLGLRRVNMGCAEGRGPAVRRSQQRESRSRIDVGIMVIST